MKSAGADAPAEFFFVTVQSGGFFTPTDFYETLMPSVSFCLFAHPIRLPLSIY